MPAYSRTEYLIDIEIHGGLSRGNMMEFDDLRKEYRSIPLHDEDMDKDPINQLLRWLREAKEGGIVEPNAMTLGTATKEGRPSTRTVLLKELDEQGLIFYTNYESRKGHEIAENPRGSVTFYWREIEKQVTIDGSIEKISENHSISYFAKRPRETQIGAWSSRQGKPIASRKTLEDAYENYLIKFQGKEISKPSWWGGYRLLPELWIFWQGRENRLHDRFLYLPCEKNQWRIQRINP